MENKEKSVLRNKTEKSIHEFVVENNLRTGKVTFF